MSNNSGTPLGCLFLLLVGVGCYFAFKWIPNPLLGALPTVIFVITVITISLNESRKADQRKFNQLCMIVQQNADTLARRRRQLVTLDAYGKELTEKWTEEKQHFVSHVIAPTVEEKSFELFKKMIPSLLDVIEHVALTHTTSATDTYQPTTTKDAGDALEIVCEDILKSIGWSVRRVGGSGDQGVDLVAEKNSLRVAIQCKNYSTPVGNSAVQEVLAGKIYEEADYAVLVASSTYTPAAIQLAQKSNVILLHSSDVENFDKLIMESLSR